MIAALNYSAAAAFNIFCGTKEIGKIQDYGTRSFEKKLRKLVSS